MRNWRTLALMGAMAAATPLLWPAAALADTGFADVPSSAYYVQAVQDLVSRHVIAGVDGTHFAPNAALTRAQLAMMLAKALSLYIPAHASTTYRDVPGDAWYAGAVSAVTKTGYMNGYPDGTFHPNDAVTREQAALVLAKAAGLSLAASESAPQGMDDFGRADAWAANGVAAAYNAHLAALTSAGTFAPLSTLSRADAAAWMDALVTGSAARGPVTETGAGTGTGSTGSAGSGTSQSGEGARAVNASILFPEQTVKVPSANNGVEIVAQAVDASGQAVHAAGIPILFTVTPVSGTDEPVVTSQPIVTSVGTASGTSTVTTGTTTGNGGETGSSGGSTTTSAAKPTPVTFSVDTDASGRATLYVRGLSTDGDAATVSVTSVNGKQVDSSSPLTLVTADTASASWSMEIHDAAAGPGNTGTYINNASTAQAGDTVTVYAQLQTPAGAIATAPGSALVKIPGSWTNVTGIDGVTLTPTNEPGVYSVTLAGAGAYPGVVAFDATATQAMLTSVSIEQIGGAGADVTGAFSVVPSTEQSAGLFTADGQPLDPSDSSVTLSGGPVTLWVRAIDAYGNPVPERATGDSVNLSDGGAGGKFALVGDNSAGTGSAAGDTGTAGSSSSSSAAVTSVTIPAGSLGVPVTYTPPAAGTYTLYASSSVAAQNVMVLDVRLASNTPVQGEPGTVTIQLWNGVSQIVPYSGPLKVTFVGFSRDAITQTLYFDHGVATTSIAFAVSGPTVVSVAESGAGPGGSLSTMPFVITVSPAS